MRSPSYRAVLASLLCVLLCVSFSGPPYAVAQDGEATATAEPPLAQELEPPPPPADVPPSSELPPVPPTADSPTAEPPTASPPPVATEPAVTDAATSAASGESTAAPEWTEAAFPELTATTAPADSVTPQPPPAAPAAPEPPLLPLMQETFDAADVTAWRMGATCLLVPSESGMALRVSGSSCAAQAPLPDMADVAVMARFRMTGGVAQLLARQSVDGAYSASLSADGYVELARTGEVLAATMTLPSSDGQWRTLRLSAIGDTVRVSVDGTELIALVDAFALLPGRVSVAGALPENPAAGAEVLVDDVTILSPTGLETLPVVVATTPAAVVAIATGEATAPVTLPELLPVILVTPEATVPAGAAPEATAPAEATPEATMEATAEPTLEATAAVPLPVGLTVEPTAEASPEPELVLLASDTFDSGDLSRWSLAGRWELEPNGRGFALRPVTTGTLATLLSDAVTDAAAQVRLRVTAGAALLSLRQSEAGAYTVRLSAGGELALYRGDVLLASADIGEPDEGGWRVLRLEALGERLRVLTDGVERLAALDADPLPAGALALMLDGEAGSGMLADDVELWVSRAVVDAQIEATPEATPDGTLTLIAEDDFESDALVNWVLRPGWSRAESDGGHALSAWNSAEPAFYSLEPLRDLVAEARVRMEQGSFRLTLRADEDSGYGAVFHADGRVELYDGAARLAGGSADALRGAWHTVRVSALGDRLSVSVDGAEVLSVRDETPLPEGVVALAAPESEIEDESATEQGRVLVDDFKLWTSASAAAELASLANTYVSGWVWRDADADGYQDSGEGGIAGVTVRLYRPGYSSPVATTTTGSSGFYGFNVPANTYYVQVFLPSGYDFTRQYLTSDWWSYYWYSDVDQFSGRSPSRYFYGGSSYYGIDAGLVQLFHCAAALDVMLVFDGSGSISDSEFNALRSFARGLANSFAISSTTARMGIVQFGAQGYTRVHLSPSTSGTTVRNTISTMPRLSGAATYSTDIQEGIQVAQGQLDRYGRAAPIPRAMVILSDGTDNDVGDPVYEASLAKNKGTVIYFVAIDSSSYELSTYVNPIASDPDYNHVFQVSGLTDLVTQLYQLANAACGTPRRPTAPTLLSPSNAWLTNDQTPLYRWNPVANVTQYEVQVSTSATFTSYVSYWTVSTSYTHYNNLYPGGRYYWRVRGWNGNVPGSYSASRYFTLDITPPNPPTLRSPANGATVVNARPVFSWYASTSSDRYRYEIEYYVPGSYSVLANVPGTSYQPPGPVPMGTYTWRVRTIDRAGNRSAWSPQWWSITIQWPSSMAPLLYRFDTPWPVLTWGHVTWATGYELWLDDNPSFANTELRRSDLAAGTQSLQVGPLGNGTWYWRIRARRSSTSWGNWSPRYSFVVID